MKVPIDNYSCIDLDAPTLPAYETIINGATRWVVWCKYCETYHKHGPAEGHRETHCQSPESPYYKTGYNLAFAGEQVKCFKDST